MEEECCACLARTPTAKFSCGHICLCSFCVILVNKCPICRQKGDYIDTDEKYVGISDIGKLYDNKTTETYRSYLGAGIHLGLTFTIVVSIPDGTYNMGELTNMLSARRDIPREPIVPEPIIYEAMDLRELINRRKNKERRQRLEQQKIDKIFRKAQRSERNRR